MPTKEKLVSWTLLIGILLAIGVAIFSLINENGSLKTDSPHNDTLMSGKDKIDMIAQNSDEASYSTIAEVVAADAGQDFSIKEIDKSISNYISIDDDWCEPEEELNDKDIQYAATIEQDWNEYVGLSYREMPDIGYGDEVFDRYNGYIAPYTDLPIDELEKLALGGNKWAMVAYVQDDRFIVSPPEQKEVARQLLITGASYHAVSFLILEELVEAQANFRKTKSYETSREHLINAIAYLFFGLQNYHTSALNAYFGNISSNEMFTGVLNPSYVLAGAEEEIKARYESLVSEIEQERNEQAITVEKPPEVVRKLFTFDLAIYQFHHPEIIEWLKDINITSDVDLGETDCTHKHMQRLKKVSGYLN
ncbi:hypothetical protein [Agaribacter flavus]|uniref:Uncharacterized protein n=1 Tax=Agaribacter flavus TaxID=1902781 RepID=A0ABV7FQW7_9ALTE